MQPTSDPAAAAPVEQLPAPELAGPYDPAVNGLCRCSALNLGAEALH